VYLSSPQTVADFCAGPHVGGETAETYVSQAIDTQCAYPNLNGTVASIGYYTGVTSVDSIQSITALPNLPHMSAFMERTRLSSQQFNSRALQAVVGRWPAPVLAPALQGQWEQTYEEIVPGAQEVLKMWQLQNGQELISIKLFVSSGSNELAYNRFITLGSLSQRPELSLEAGPAELGHFSAVDAQPGHNRVLWLYQNVTMEIRGANTAADVVAIAQWYYQWATTHLTDELAVFLPSTDIVHTSLAVAPQDKFYVAHNSSQNIKLTFEEANGALRLLNQEDKALLFEVNKPGKASLRINLVNQDTLLVNSVTLAIPSVL
jgi:hypothetical protein